MSRSLVLLAPRGLEQSHRLSRWLFYSGNQSYLVQDDAAISFLPMHVEIASVLPPSRESLAMTLRIKLWQVKGNFQKALITCLDGELV
jgi:hypothetical protein